MKWEVYNDIPGTLVSDLTASAKYPSAPDQVGLLAGFEPRDECLGPFGWQCDCEGHQGLPDHASGGPLEDEGSSGTTAADSSGGGNDGTLIGEPTWVAGQIGQALSFDGSRVQLCHRPLQSQSRNYG
jgi:hypothetical protein